MQRIKQPIISEQFTLRVSRTIELVNLLCLYTPGKGFYSNHIDDKSKSVGQCFRMPQANYYMPLQILFLYSAKPE